MTSSFFLRAHADVQFPSENFQLLVSCSFEWKELDKIKHFKTDINSNPSRRATHLPTPSHCRSFLRDSLFACISSCFFNLYGVIFYCLIICSLLKYQISNGFIAEVALLHLFQLFIHIVFSYIKTWLICIVHSESLGCILTFFSCFLVWIIFFYHVCIKKNIIIYKLYCYAHKS